LRQFHVRGLAKAHCECVWARLTYNIKQWMRFVGKGDRGRRLDAPLAVADCVPQAGQKRHHRRAKELDRKAMSPMDTTYRNTSILSRDF